MPSRRAAGLRLTAAVIVTTYVAPVLLPGLSGLSHDVFHAVAQPAAVHSGDHDHAHAHPHAHVEGGPVHTHVELVDALLAAPQVEDALEDSDAPAAEAPAPGAHLPTVLCPPHLLPVYDSGPALNGASRLASLLVPPRTPPPRA